MANVKTQHKYDNLSNFLSECQKFVCNIEQYSGDDPLLPWYNYLQWFDENFTINFKHETIFVHILTACLCKFENDKRYKQDRRFIKLFIKFIHFQEERNSLYEIMVSNGIGTEVADLYINWAFYFNMKQEYEAAEHIFRRGIDARAEPLAQLEAAHTDFGCSMSQNVLYKNDVTFQQQEQVRMKKQLQEITALRMISGSGGTENKSLALQLFDKEKLENYCIPFSGTKRIETGQTRHNESLVQNLLDSARKMRRKQSVKVSGSRLNFNDDDDIGSSGDISASQTLKPIPLLPGQNMYEKGIRIGKNYPRKNQPQNIGESHAYVDTEIGTYRNGLPGYDKLMLIPATNVAFSPEELKAYRWFKQRGITNAFTIEQDRIWAIGYDVPIRCADIFPRSNFPQSEWNLPRIADYYLNDNLGPHKLKCNMSELYPGGCSEEFSLEEIMWRKRKAKVAQSQVIDGINCKEDTNKSVGKSVGRRLNRTNSTECSSKLSPIIEMDLKEHDDDRHSEFGAVAVDQPEQTQQKLMTGNELTYKKRKSSIFPTFDALNDTCTTQMFHNLLHRSVVSTPNAKIPKYDTMNANMTRDGLLEETKLKLFIDETIVVGSDIRDPNIINPQKSNDRPQFAIYEDSIKVTCDMKQLENTNKNDAHNHLMNENKENVLAQMELDRSKLATTEMKYSNTLRLSFSQKKSESMMKDQNQQSNYKSLALSTVHQNQQQQPPPPASTNKISYASFSLEEQKTLVEPLKNVCGIFEAIAAISGPESCQMELNRSKEILTTVLNATTIKSESQTVNQNNCSIFKEPAAPVNTTKASPVSFCSKKTPNQSQYYELLDTTEEFEALEAQCASPPVSMRYQTPNKLTVNSTVDKASIMLPPKTTIAAVNGTLNIGHAEIENRTKEDHIHYDDGQNAIEMADADPDEDNDDDDIRKSIYVPQPELKFNEKDADWHEVTVFLENAATEENEYKIEEIDLNETRQRIDTQMLNMKDLNPFEPELQKDVLADIGFIDRLQNMSNCKLMKIVKPLKPKSSVEIGKNKYLIRKLIGEGAYGKVFTAECTKTKQTYAFKQQRPPNLWEYYVCQEIRERIEDQWIRKGFMSIDFAVIGNNATIYTSKFAKYGTLLDVCQKIQQKTGKNIDECIIMILVKQMLTILEYFHDAKFIHADIKPDNFLLMDKLGLDYLNPEIVVQLIDFGQSIDLNYFSNHVFWAKVRTEHFVCTEMMENKPWTYHCDYFCLASTIYTMVAGKYMIVKRNETTKSYKPQKLPRYVNTNLWDEILDKLINIPSLTKLPLLAEMNSRLDTELNAIGSKKIINAIRKFNQALDQ